MTALEKLVYRTTYYEVDAEDENEARERVLSGELPYDDKEFTDQFEISEVEHVEFVRGDEDDGATCFQCGRPCVMSQAGKLHHWDEDAAEYDEDGDRDHQAILEEGRANAEVD